MRVAALHSISRTTIQRYNEPAPIIDAASDHVVARRLVRCECGCCGAHSNVVPAADADARCPNCGAGTLVPVEGADIIRPASERPRA
jgi:Zn finger protein HypA/HybF involved in hydrogenase expression